MRVMEAMYKCHEGKYDVVANLCVSLTKYRINRNRVRAEDLGSYSKNRKYIYGGGDEKLSKRKRASERYHEKRKRRTAVRRTMNYIQTKNSFQASNLVNERRMRTRLFNTSDEEQYLDA